MFQQEDHIVTLVTGHLHEQLSPAQKAALQTWLASKPENQAWFDHITSEETLQAELKTFNQANTEQNWQQVKARLNTGKILEEGTKETTKDTQQQKEKEQKHTQETTQRSGTKLWAKIAIAAAIASMIASAGIWFLKTDHTNTTTEQTAKENDVDPGTQGATLTLANGTKIRLQDAKTGTLAKQSGITISKTQDGQISYQQQTSTDNSSQINTLSTTNGETYQITLPDGTTVWLNSASSITYAANLTQNGKRKITLQGEAYFQVSKDKQHRFIVVTKDQQVEVLGTQFNMNSYTDEAATATTLIEGSVKVSQPNPTEDKKYTIIKPGEQAQSTENGISISKPDIDNIIDWKNGDFNLDGLNLKTAMRKIARWYNVEIVYSDDLSDNISSGGWISRKAKLSTILEGIEQSGLAHFKVKGRTVYVSK